MTNRKSSKRLLEAIQSISQDDAEEAQQLDMLQRRRPSISANPRTIASMPGEKTTSSRIVAGFNMKNTSNAGSSRPKDTSSDVEDQLTGRIPGSRHSSRSRTSDIYENNISSSRRPSASSDRKSNEFYQDRLSINILAGPDFEVQERNVTRRAGQNVELDSLAEEHNRYIVGVDTSGDAYDEDHPSYRRRSKIISSGSSRAEDADKAYNTKELEVEYQFQQGRSSDSSTAHAFSRNVARYIRPGDDAGADQILTSVESDRRYGDVIHRSSMSRDVFPLPIEIPESITDADAFRRYLSQNHMDGVGKGDGVRNSSLLMPSEMSQLVVASGGAYLQSNSLIGSSTGLNISYPNQLGQSSLDQPSRTNPPQIDCQQTNYQKRTTSLSHAIMTLALLSASAAQLRFIVSYSHLHSYPTLNYFLICSCIVIEVFVGIGFVVLARFDFSEDCQEKLHSYLIFGLFVVTVANVIVAAFALDDHICDSLKPTTASPTSSHLFDESLLSSLGDGVRPDNRANTHEISVV